MTTVTIDHVERLDRVRLTYDFGLGAREVCGAFEGIEHRDTGEDLCQVREPDGTRYAVPVGMLLDCEVQA